MLGVQSLTDVLKHIFLTLQFHTLFPSITLTLSTYFIFSDYSVPNSYIVGGPDLTFILIIISVILSNLFTSLNGVIIRFAEGYTHKSSKLTDFLFGPLFQFREERHLLKRKKLDDEIYQRQHKSRRIDEILGEIRIYERLCEADLSSQIDDLYKLKKRLGDEIANLEYNLDLNYCEVKTMPSSLGNKILSFEYYALKRYKIDGSCLWACFLPVLEEKKFMPFLAAEKSRLDFLLNFSIVVLVIALQFIYLFFTKTPSDIYYLVCSVGLAVIAYILYSASAVVAIDWGAMVKAAFDLYRHDLYRALHLPHLPDKNIEREQEEWENISSFLRNGNKAEFQGFSYPKSKEKNSQSKDEK